MGVTLIAFAAGGLILGTASAAHAGTHSRRVGAYHWAIRHAGAPYVWGGTGPGYDCSGLVMMAWRHEGVSLPHNTGAMLASGLLVRVKHWHRGDLAFFGTSHVELVHWRHTTFGALESGKPVWWHRWFPGGSWRPTAFYRVR